MNVCKSEWHVSGYGMCVCKCRSECENIYGEMDVVLEIIVCVQMCQYVCINMSMWF